MRHKGLQQKNGPQSERFSDNPYKYPNVYGDNLTIYHIVVILSFTQKKQL